MAYRLCSASMQHDISVLLKRANVIDLDALDDQTTYTDLLISECELGCPMNSCLTSSSNVPTMCSHARRYSYVNHHSHAACQNR
jgi:hypothetical protein